MKKKMKKLMLAKETVRGLERQARGGTGYPSSPYCQLSDPIAGCGGGGDDTSAGFYADPGTCSAKPCG